MFNATCRTDETFHHDVVTTVLPTVSVVKNLVKNTVVCCQCLARQIIVKAFVKMISEKSGEHKPEIFLGVAAMCWMKK
jgi:hypothetical protein